MQARVVMLQATLCRTFQMTQIFNCWPAATRQGLLTDSSDREGGGGGGGQLGSNKEVESTIGIGKPLD